MSQINLKKDGPVLTLTLNAPEQLNAMDIPMGKEFQRIIKSLGKDKSVRAVIITGAGRAFSSGGNLAMIEDKFGKSKTVNERELKSFYKMFLGLRDIPQPVIAAINGPAVGAGFCMAMACDLRYAATTAKMGANFSRIGLAPGMGGTYLITRVAGPVNAAEILLTGRVFDAKKAMEYGILNGLCEPDTLIPTVASLAQEIACNGPLPVSQIKKGVQLAQHRTLEQMFAYDAKMQAICFASQDIREGIKAIREKRDPIFKGL
jgi:enoyl-CoA hydratase